MEYTDLDEASYKKLIDLTRSSGNIDDVEAYLEQFLESPQFHQLQVFTNQAIRILETSGLRYLYISDSMQELTGFTPKEISDGGLMFIYKRTYWKDILRLTQATINVRRALSKLTPQEKMRARFSFDVRFKCKDGTLKKILQNCHILKLNEGADPQILLFASTDISAYKHDSRMNYSLSVFEPGKGFVPVLRDSFHGEDCPFSAREMEILKLTSNGLAEKEIADTLSLSVETVKTHRKNMLQKLPAKNAVDMVRMAIVNNWI
ncbi:MAG: hypothetical protein KF846_14830 [Cyclobacteriaceae bacterium]|nr:hypothetical protein [Cyclobacteriaceae bacterium]MBX2957436.1 hypothetical protein [Cyclobacteriaceae bacterium]